MAIGIPWAAKAENNRRDSREHFWFGVWLGFVLGVLACILMLQIA